MFFSRLALFALPAIAAASALPRTNVNSCNIGSSQFCCNNLQSASSFSDSDKYWLSFFGVNTDNLTGQVGLACNPVTGAGAVAGGAVGSGTAGCNAQNLCCQDSQANGMVASNCNPTIINL